MNRYRIVLAVVLVSCSGFAATIHVPIDQPSIQSGIDAAAPGDTVTVAGGIYMGTGNRDVRFHGKRIVVTSDSNATATIINCQADSSSFHRGFIFDGAEDSLAVLRGITIRGGYAAAGGAVLVSGDATPTIIGCVFEYNRAVYGGGLAIDGSPHAAPASARSRVRNCRIRRNWAAFGGGISIINKGSAALVSCRITDNRALRGGGLFVDVHSVCLLDNCVVARNRATGGTGTGGGGGLFLAGGDTLEIRNTTLVRNSSATLGSVLHSSPSSSLQIVSSILSGNDGPATITSDSGLLISCSNVYGNTGGDWVGAIAPQASSRGNFSRNPLFCDSTSTNFTLQENSPCNVDYSPCRTVVGANRGVAYDLDTTAPAPLRADTFLAMTIPQTEWLTGADSINRFSWIHVGACYFPDGFLGYNRWMIANPYPNTWALGPTESIEDPCLRVSNDGISWTPFPGCRDPLFDNDSCAFNGFPAAYLSDVDMAPDLSGRLWVIWRASAGATTRDTMPKGILTSLWTSFTTDGVNWSRETMIKGWGYDSLVSPAIWVDSSGMFNIAAVKICDTNNIIVLYKAGRLDSTWIFVDTVRNAGSIYPFILSSPYVGEQTWHVEVVDYNGDEKLFLITSTSAQYHRLYLGKSTDGGRHLRVRYLPFLQGSGHGGTNWDADDIYRSTGFFVNTNSQLSLELYYPARNQSRKSTAASWFLGRTSYTFPGTYTAACPCCHGIRGNVDADPNDVVDISDVMAMIDYLATNAPITSCFDEADCDQSGSIDISDLFALIDHLNGAALLPDCP